MVCQKIALGMTMVVVTFVGLPEVPHYFDCSRNHGCQGYLYGVPTKFKARGLNVLEAQKIANNMGEDARVIVVDAGLYDSAHYDLPKPEWTEGDKTDYHATNSAGIILGRLNFSGVTGIAAEAKAVSAYVNNVNFSFSLRLIKNGDVITCSQGRYLFPFFDAPGKNEDLTRFLIKEKGVHVVQSGKKVYEKFWLCTYEIPVSV